MKHLSKLLSSILLALLLAVSVSGISYADFPNVPNSTFNEAYRLTNPMHLPFLYNPVVYHDIRQGTVSPHPPKRVELVSIQGEGVNTNIAQGTDMIQTDDGKILITANIPVNLVKELPTPFEDKTDLQASHQDENMPVILLLLQDKEALQK